MVVSLSRLVQIDPILCERDTLVLPGLGVNRIGTGQAESVVR